LWPHEPQLIQYVNLEFLPVRTLNPTKENTSSMLIQLQIIWLFLLAIPVACVAWTVTHEEIFRELRDFCAERSLSSKTIIQRKLYYLFTCEYCFSHYVVMFFLFLTNYKLLMDDWRGYVIAGFSLVWVANVYMGLFAFVRQGIKIEKAEIEVLEKTEK
jgi:hypothetical protein